MKKNKGFIVIAAFLFSAFVSGLVSCGAGGGETVAVIDGENISSDFFLYTQSKGFKNKSLKEQKSDLQSFYHTLLRAHAAEEMDMAEQPALKYKIRSKQRRALVDAAYQSYVVDSVVTDDMIREAYENMDEKRHIRHIMIGYKDAIRSKTSRSVHAAESLATAVKSKITGGELDFAAAAREYSEGPSADKGGDLGMISWGQMMDSFQGAAWELEPNTLSDPVRTEYGFHLIEVTDVDTVKLQRFKQEKERIRQNIIRNKRREINNRSQRGLQEIIDQVGFTVHDSVMNRIAGDLVRQMKTTESPRDSVDLSAVLERIEYEPVAEFNGEPADKEQFRTILLTMQQGNFQGARDVKSFLRRLRFEFQQEAIKRFAEMRELEDYRNTPHKLRWEKARILDDAYYNNHVLKDFPPTEDSLRAYYQRMKDRKYSKPADLHVREIYFTSRDTADKVSEMLQNGEQFTALAGRYTKRADTKNSQGDLGWFKSTRYGPIGEQAKKMSPGEVAGPIQVGTGWSIIKLEGKKGGGHKPFDEIKKTVKNDYTDDYKPKYIQENIDSLATEYNAEVRYQYLETI